MHPKLAVDPLLWFANFAMEKYWRSSAAVHQQLQGLIQIWYICAEVRTVNFGTMITTQPNLGRSSLDVSRRKVGRIAEAKSCGCTRSNAESSKRSWKVPQVYAEAHASSGRRRRHRRCSGRVFQQLLCPGVQHHHGSQLLAAVMVRWPSFSRFGSRKQPRNYSHVTVFTLILRMTSLRPSELLELIPEDLGPSLVPLPPLMFDRDRGHRNRSIYQDESPPRVGTHGPPLVFNGQQALARKCGNI